MDRPMAGHKKSTDEWVAKPAILTTLEDMDSCPQPLRLTNGQKLSAMEIIVFVFNVLKHNVSQKSNCVSFRELLGHLERHLKKALTAIGGHSRTPVTTESVVDFRHMKDVLQNILKDFIYCKIYSFDPRKDTIGFEYVSDQWLRKVELMLDNSLLAALKNFLTFQLRKYGRKSVADIETRLNEYHNYLFEHLFCGSNGYQLIDLIECNPNQFKVEYFGQKETNGEKTNAYVDVYPKPVSHEIRLSSTLLYAFGPQVNDFEGVVYFRNRSFRPYVRSRVEQIDSERDICFKIKANFTTIYGQKVAEEDIQRLLHTNDHIVFDAKLMADGSDEDTDSRLDLNNNSECLAKQYRSWTVTAITAVSHSGRCFLTPFCEDLVISGDN